MPRASSTSFLLWFAWKFVPLWYQQQPMGLIPKFGVGCDLLENSYLCGISNNEILKKMSAWAVVICLKIRTFVVSATTHLIALIAFAELWFAWKFVPLWYQQQLCIDYQQRQHVVICLKIRTFVVSATTLKRISSFCLCCDLLENSYLCGISNNPLVMTVERVLVVICLKIRTFVVSATTTLPWLRKILCCDLLENSYLCGISNNSGDKNSSIQGVVICLKIRTFVVSATTSDRLVCLQRRLWFAWKFVPLWYQQQRIRIYSAHANGCDLLENSYLCGISNNLSWIISWLADSYKIVAQKNNWYYKMKSHSKRMGFFTLMTMPWRIIFKLL